MDPFLPHMTTKPAIINPAAKKKLLARIAAAQRQADAAKKAARLAKLGFRNAKQKFKEAKRAAKKFRKSVKALKAELAALSVKKPVRRPVAKKKAARPAPVVEIAPAPIEVQPAVAGETTVQ